MRILQFGDGGFLRGFIEFMVQGIKEKLDIPMAVTIVKPRPGSFDAGYAKQNCAYHLVTRGRQNGSVVDTISRIDCVDGMINPYEDFDAFVAAARDPEMRCIVSNTTEAGLVYRVEDRAGDRPAPSFPGKLTQALRERYVAFGGSAEKAVLVLPCELIERNGAVLREMVLKHAARWYEDAGFDHWLAEACSFPDTLVDRIVPGYDESARVAVRELTGMDDELAITCEPYHLFVVQGKEREDILPFRKAGFNVIWTDNLEPYRILKVRILNGGHTFLSAAGLGMGIETVAQAVADPVLRPALDGFLREEVNPAIDRDPAEKDAYAATVLDRFSNPFVEHRLESIALNAVSKWKTRILPVARKYADKTGRPPLFSCFSLAALLRRYTEDTGIKDEPGILSTFASIGRIAGGDPDGAVRAMMGSIELWGDAIPDTAGIHTEVRRAYRDIRENGTTEALRRLLKF